MRARYILYTYKCICKWEPARLSMLSWTWWAVWFCLSRLMFAVTECLGIPGKNQGSLGYATSWHVKKSLPPPTHGSQDTMQQVDEIHVMWGCFGKVRQQQGQWKSSSHFAIYFYWWVDFSCRCLGFAWICKPHLQASKKHIYVHWGTKKG